MFSMHNVFVRSCEGDDTELDAVQSDHLLEQPVHRDHESVEKAFARVFATDDGQAVLSHLQSMTFQRALGPEASDTQLRYLEGQRAMIATIMRLIRSGRTGSHAHGVHH